MSAVVTKGLLKDPAHFARSRKPAKPAATRASFGLLGQGLAALISESLPHGAGNGASDAATRLQIEAMSPRRKRWFRRS